MVFLELAIVILLGGWIYSGIEILWRRRTHWTMFLTGGLCFAWLYALATRTSLPTLLQCALGALIITFVEFSVGCVVNLALGWKVWDYSRNRFNLFGQVCLSFSGLWFLLSWPALLLARAIQSGVSLLQK
ncbi:MAG: putative ABC transporter permease [Christensenellales bacterium]|jgi:uncharacterized membrane protein